MKRSFPLNVALAACGPVSQQQAEKDRFERARLAQRPRGYFGAGITSNGQSKGVLDVEISSGFLQGRDPSAVYDQCVYQKSGLPPSRPLYSRPDWKS